MDLSQQENDRMEYLDTKCYFEWGLNEADAKELDKLIAKIVGRSKGAKIKGGGF